MQTDYLSTTKLLKIAHQDSNGNISQAIDHLRGLSHDHVNANSAIRVLRMKVQKRPGASTFSFRGCGFVEVA